MNEKQDEIKKKLPVADATNDSLMFAMVKWTEDGITYLGTVTEIYYVHEIKYLSVMTIFGKRFTVKMSKVKLQTQHSKA